MRQRYPSRPKRAFTLVELLTVVVIISIIASLSVTAMNGTMQTARANKTKGTIQKIDAAIMSIYENYEERFEGILKGDMVENYRPGGYTHRETARLKMHLMRDLMRMEMPSHWGEVFQDPGSGTKIPDSARIEPIDYVTSQGRTTTFHAKRPAVFDYYFREAQRARERAVDAGETCPFGDGSAELLFLIIMNLNPDALENFSGTEIADTDGNGLLEFVDGWGKPIYFLRTASGFTGTDRQPDIVRYANLNVNSRDDLTVFWSSDTVWPTDVENDGWPSNDLCNSFRWATRRWSDPFDPNDDFQLSWFLYPIIVSAGPDGQFDISYGRLDSSGKLLSPSSPEDLDPFRFPTGIPLDKAGDGMNHFDNIHNHNISGF